MRNMIVLNQFIGLLMLALVTRAQKNVASIVGKSVTLHCDLEHTDPPQMRWVDWIHNQGREPQGIFDSTDNMDKHIDASHPNGDRMKIEEDYSLTISQLKFGNTGDSGEYICFSKQADGKELQQTLQLNIAGLPVCSGDGDLMEEDTSVFKCMAQFSGSDLPALDWYLDSEKVESVDMNEIEKAMQDYTIDSASEMYDGKTMTCKMEYGDLTEECSIPVTVKYLVNKVEITPSGEEIRVDDEVKCTANGNPNSKVKLEFTGTDVSESLEGDDFVSFIVPKAWEGVEVKAVCTGSNTLNGQVENLENQQTFKVLAPPTPSTTTASSTVKATTMPIKTEPPKPDPTEKPAPQTPKPAAGTDEEEKPGKKTGGGNIVGIVAGVIIAALVIVVIVIAVACILRKSSKKHKGAKPVPTKEEDIKRMEDGKGVWNSSLAYSEGEKHGRYQQNHPFPPPSNGAIPTDVVFYHKDGSGDNTDSVDVGLVDSVDLDNNRDSDTNLDAAAATTALDSSSVNFTDVDYSQILHPQNSPGGT